MPKKTPQTSSDIIAHANKILHELSAGVTKYIDAQRTLLMGIDNENLRAIDFATEQLRTDLSLPDDITTNVLEVGYNYYVHIDKITNAIDVCKSALLNEKYYKQMIYLKTAATADTLVALRAKCLNLIDTYVSINDDSILESFMPAVAALDARDVVAFCRDREINKFTLRCIQKIPYDDSTTNMMLESLIEDAKDKICQSTRIAPTADSTVMPPLYTQQILPLTNCMPLEQLLAEHNLDNHDVNKYNIIDISGERPIDFSIQTLVGPEASEYVSQSLSGLTKKLLKKYSTVVRLDSTNVNEQNNLSKFVSADVPTIQTLDHGSTYRLVQVMPSLYTGQSTRPERYNEMTSTKFEQIYNRSAEFVQNQYATWNALEIPSAPIKDAIKTQLTDGFPAKLRKLLYNRQLNPITFKQLIVDKKLIGIVINRVLGRDMQVREASITHICKVDRIINDFTRQLSAVYEEKKPQLSVYSDYDDEELARQMIDYAYDMYAASIEELDRNSTWTSTEKTLKEFTLGLKS